ncbi:DUF4132 domain-containing protein [Tumidithrix elongata RA019]|uniref:DUF4132 domain-containing protein n=1 Tax=Tumidithrix elongata BACA0141 TaxID=2716417 RepID=A0AAW9PSW0_9CYAN|nr:DUF4132 domain-containing protein [Tumidithrix elongata RA019]
MTQFNNPLGLSEQIIDLLLEDIKRFEIVLNDEEMRDRLVQYVLDGSDEQVLQDLPTAINAALSALQSQQAQPHQALLSLLQPHDFHSKFQEQWQKSVKARSKFWENPTIQEAPFYFRLAQVYKLPFNHIYNVFNPYGNAPIDWLTAFLQAIAGNEMYHNPDLGKDKLNVSAKTIAEMLVIAEEKPDRLARIAYLAAPDDYQAKNLSQIACALKDFSEYSLQHLDVIHEALSHTNSKQKILALEIIKDRQIPIASFVEAIASLAVSSAKSVRTLAELIIQKNLEVAIPSLENLATKGKADERFYAVKLLGTQAQNHDFLKERLNLEKAEKVKDAIAEILEAPAPVETPSSEPSFPPLPEINREAPLPESVKIRLEELMHQAYQASETHYQRNKAQQSWLKPPQSLKSSQIDSFVDMLQRGLGKDCRNNSKIMQGNWLIDSHQQFIKAFLETPDLELIHVVRFLLVMGQINYIERSDRSTYNPGALNSWAIGYLSDYQKAKGIQFGLRDLAAVFKALEMDENSIGLTFLDPYQGKGLIDRFDWVQDSLYPYFQERLSSLEEILKPQPTSKSTYHYGKNFQRQTVLQILEKFPEAPPNLRPILWEIALGNSKSEKPLAQRCLENLSDTPEKVMKALSDRSAEIRIAAADWMSRLAIPNAIDVIKAALKTEKSELVKDALIRSLEKLGASVEEFLDRAGLQAEAKAGLKKGIPDALAWFPFDNLPVVRWEDSNAPVDREILTWFILQAYKQKTAEPSPLVNRYVSYFKKSDREDLGKFVLQAWIGQDTIPKYTYQEADDLAKPQTASMWSYHQQFLSRTPDTEEKIYQQLLQQYQSYKQYTAEQAETYARQTAAYQWQQRLNTLTITEEQLHRTHVNQFLGQLKGSAIKEKGVLAMVASCGGASVIPFVSNYLQTYYGRRAAQCMALLQMLVWVEDFSAIQLLLSVAKRFRTKSIQEEAQKCVEILADRKGWSTDELGDRTIPTLGFDEKAELVLEYGDSSQDASCRKFTAKLDRDFSFVLYNPEGKAIKSLPDPRKDEDAEAVKEAKKLLSDAKKQLKSLLTLQKERLYEAMCTQRSWQFRDWDLFLNKHPVISRYCQTLVWSVYKGNEIDGEAISQTFRPLEDGTLTDVEDNAVTIPPEATIRLAHASLLDRELSGSWQTHFADYEVVPLFSQFGQDTYILPEEKAQTTEISDFEGYMVETFQIRGKATKLGYTRGQSQDGGWFYDYRKSFAGLKLEAAIQFTGNFLPEENRSAALEKLSFQRLEENTQDYYYRQPALPLSEIPPVLLSEVWNDLKAIAAQGIGYDPDWQKKSAY